LDVLMNDVFVGRMGGLQTSGDQDRLLGSWLDAIRAPQPPPVADPAAVARGGALFHDSKQGCVLCHGGALLTTNQIVDVGTSGTFKVPSLRGVWARPPYLHDGCAMTLYDRFGTCATPQHGSTAQLDAGQISDMVAFLETL
jgi:cytochrome c peroxidase